MDEAADITDLILAEHDTFRRAFAALDKLQAPDTDPGARPGALAAIWTPLAAHLDRHALVEERVLFPALLRYGTNAEHETLDAIGDHNDIRDALRESARHQPDSDAWWSAVNRARAANTEHMAEEEDEALPDLRRTTTRGQRIALGRAFVEMVARVPPEHAAAGGNPDPAAYLKQHRRPGPADRPTTPPKPTPPRPILPSQGRG